MVALSFDAGGDAAGVPSILRTLRAHGVPVRFLLTRQADQALTDRHPGREQRDLDVQLLVAPPEAKHGGMVPLWDSHPARVQPGGHTDKLGGERADSPGQSVTWDHGSLAVPAFCIGTPGRWSPIVRGDRP